MNRQSKELEPEESFRNSSGFDRQRRWSEARYTQVVGWSLRTNSIAMLMVLSVLPVAGTLCAITCEDGALDASTGHQHHHGAAAESPKPTVSGVALIGKAPALPCDHDAAMLQATTGAERMTFATSAPPTTLTVVESFAPSDVRQGGPSPGAPPGRSPSTSTPVVLRV